MEKMSKDTEMRILHAIEDAIVSTNGGEHPNAAIQKQAEAQQFTPQVVQRMVEAYNTSRTLAHLKHAKDHSRADDFPLADAAVILQEMYPSTVTSPAKYASATKVHPDYRYAEEINFMRKGAGASPPPLTDKKPGAIARDPEMVARSNYNKRASLARKLDDCKSAYRQSHYRLWNRIKAASEYFKQLYHTPFEEAEKRAVSEYGTVGKSIMELIHEQSGTKEKRAELKDLRPLTYDPAVKPYCFISESVKVAHAVYGLAEHVLESERELKAFCKEAGIPDDKLIPGPEPTPGVLDGVLSGGAHRPFEKNALLPVPHLSGALLLQGGMGALGLEDPAESGAKEKAEMAAADPVHESALKSIEAKALMNDFLSNDPILSDRDPDEVRTAFNDLTKLAPSLATQPGVMRAMLRRTVQQEGVVEPHEAGQLTDLEGSIRRLEGAEAPRR